jgi:hypothetical protein
MLPPSLPAAPPPEPASLVQRAQLEVLLRSEEWSAVRHCWNALNRLGPLPESQYGQWMPVMENPGLLDPVKADSMIAGLRRSTEALASRHGDTPAVRAFRTAALMVETRALRLSRINPVFLTRMVPSWTVTLEEGLLTDIHGRLWELERLRSQGELGEDLFNAASDTLLRRVEAWTLLHDMAGTRYSGWDYPMPPDSLMEVELLYETLAGEFGEDRLAGFREMRPYLETLLADLLDGMN